MTALPVSLKDGYSRWAVSGRKPQQNFTWRPGSWKRRFGNHLPCLAGVDLVATIEVIEQKASGKSKASTPTIDRAIVTELHDPRALRLNGEYDPQAVVTAFIAAMVWGYGATGYGPYRTERVLKTDPKAVEHLIGIAEVVQKDGDGGGVSGYEAIAQGRSGNSAYLKYLGPAFGTKFLYFLTAASEDVTTTPVMDAVVRRWFAREAGIALNVTSWKTGSYTQYLGHLDDWRAALAAGAGGRSPSREDVEYVIFARERGDRTVWSDAEFTADQLLDMLQGDIEELDAERGSEEGMALFTQLSEWVAGTGELRG